MKKYISNLEIKNYRSCRKTSINLNDDLTVLIGKNGSGKTSIFNSLLLLKQVSKSRAFRRRKADSEFFSSSILSFNFNTAKYTRGFKFFLTYDTDERNRDVLMKAEVSIKNKGDKKWSKKIDVDGLNSFSYMDFGHFRQGQILYRGKSSKGVTKAFKFPFDESQFDAITEVVEYLNSIRYFSATEFSDPSSTPVTFEVNERGLREAYGYGNKHQQFLFDLYETSIKDIEFYNNYKDLVSSEGLDLISDIEFKVQTIQDNSYEVRAGGNFRNIKSDKNIIIPYLSLDGLNLSFNQLSEGTFKTLALVFYILKSENEMLLVEEPEVCIHHGLLNSITELLQIKSNLSQIVVSTHSDNILDNLRQEDIVLVEKKSDSGTEAKKLSEKLGVNEFKALKYYLSEVGNLGDYWKEGGLY